MVLDPGILLIKSTAPVEKLMHKDNMETLSSCDQLRTRLKQLISGQFCCVIINYPTKEKCEEVCRELYGFNALKCFIIIWHPEATEDPIFRQTLMDNAAHMVTYCPASLVQMVNQSLYSNRGEYECPFCQRQSLTKLELYQHTTTFHINQPVLSITCPICLKRPKHFHHHLHYSHLNHKPSTSGVFSIVICRRPKDGAFLMVQEVFHQGFWVPGGQLNKGEGLRGGAMRETLEEAGVQITLKGVLEVLVNGPSWKRVTFYAEPANSQFIPKSRPDFESCGACWVHASQLSSLNLRDSSTPEKWFPKLQNDLECVLPLEIPQEYKEAFAHLEF